MITLDDNFLLELQKKTITQSKLTYDIYNRCYIDASLSPDECNKVELLELLHKLERDKCIALPKSKDVKYWMRGRPELPKWIKILKATERKEDIILHWHPKLSFMYREKNPATIKSAKIINEYLINRNSNPFSIAIKERSLLLFNDEKKLDRLRKGIIFKHITLEDIDCYLVATPIISTVFNNQSDKIIIIENYNTYDSFCKYNRKMDYYNEVIYGWGVNANSEDMANAIYERWEKNNNLTISYFGDIDPTGINIAIGLGNRLKRTSENINFEIAKKYYRYILDNGVEDTKNFKAKKIENMSLTKLLFGDMYLEIDKLFEDKIRIAQERLNIEVLMKNFRKELI
ncbi:MAG: Unknown protein [uncultured Sulfurovum sp.]|uniref:Wadjet protein JetD C-terminal domain-containing protein n=1 Tax=uncultured Sulfurovum sp. TaxID=269237 RepID=A0A6S6T5P6_9BACT|nr:MAG: Unknown protein [uncultured Sulfurovum sp.]